MVVTRSKLVVVSILLILSAQAYADWSPSGVSLSYGQGQPNNLTGYRLATQWDWGVDWLASTPIKLSGYWDASVARWSTEGNSTGNYTSLWAVGFDPIFRLQLRSLLAAAVSPYLEAGVGPAWLSASHLGERDLGAHWAFQDLVGVGIGFGKKHQFDLSYHYLHYSNAGLWPPNCGIDVKMLATFSYRF